MRGVAAIAVALCHLAPELAPAGYIAVDLFFAMSGVVLMQAYGWRLHRGMSLRSFLSTRVIRLYPLYAIGSVIGLAVTIALHRMSAKQLLISLPSAFLMLPAPLFHQGQLFPFNPPSWSLFFELLINGCLAIFLFRARAGILIISIFISALLMSVLAGQHYHLNLGFRWSIVQILGGGARVCFSFLIGMLLYQQQKGAARPTGWSALIILIVTALMLFTPAPEEIKAVRDLLLALVISPLLVAAAIHIEPPVIIRRSFQTLGDMSYPLYAVHFPLVLVWQAKFPKGFVSIGMQATIFAISLIVLSVLLERFCDQPLRAQLSLWLKLRESALPQSTIVK